MRLRLTTPTHVIADREVTYVQAEDWSGRFGILPGHEPFLTALVPSILVYRYSVGRLSSVGVLSHSPGRRPGLQRHERESYVAVRNGVLRVTEEEVQVAVRDAHLSDDLAGLQQEIRKNREAYAARSYRATRSMYQMQIAAWRQLVEFEHVPAR